MEKFFYNIKEVSEMLNVPKSTIRFWEKSFKEITPQRTSGNRRLFKPEDIEILKKIKFLLYNEGISIDAAKRRLKEKPSDFEEIIKELQEIKNILEGK